MGTNFCYWPFLASLLPSRYKLVVGLDVDGGGLVLVHVAVALCARRRFE